MRLVNMYLKILNEKILFSISEIEDKVEKNIIREELIIPKSFEISRKLNYISRFIEMIIKQYKIRYVSITTENNIKDIETIKIEAVIEEAISNCGVEKCR